MNIFEKNVEITESERDYLVKLYLNKEVRIIKGARMHYGKIGKVTEVNPYGMLNVRRSSDLVGCDENILLPPDYVEFSVGGEYVPVHRKKSEDDIINEMLAELKNPKIGAWIAPGLPFVKARTENLILITNKAELQDAFTPEKIIHSGPKTIVFFKNGEKVIVSCGENETYDEYTAFCAALAKKIFGNTSRAKKTMQSVTVEKKKEKIKCDEDNVVMVYDFSEDPIE